VDRTSTDTGRVEILMNQSVMRHPRRADIQKICRADERVHGCTDFPAERLDANCELKPEGWVINTSAEINAVIQLSDNFKKREAHVLMHELRHLEELTASLREHLQKVTSRRYRSENVCRTYANVLSATPYMRVLMNEMRTASNEKLR
jgi:hypothetical protein